MKRKDTMAIRIESLAKALGVSTEISEEDFQECLEHLSYREKYPPFTAEKQIELIKWLIQKYKTILIEHKLNLFYINIRDIYTGKVHIEFDETIAGLINNIWQDLTEEEKQQVKGILE